MWTVSFTRCWSVSFGRKGLEDEDMDVKIRELIKAFESIGVKDSQVVNEMARFKVLDQMISASAEVKSWGITREKLYELAKESTVQTFGDISYTEEEFGRVYGPSFGVELMELIDTTGLGGHISSGEQWRLPLKEIIETHKHTDGIILFAFIEEYAALAEEILQEIPAERLLFYTSSQDCYDLFRKIYPLAPVIAEWPEDVIFDHIVSAGVGVHTPAVTMMEMIATRVGNITEQGTAHFFVPVTAIWDQVNMNRVAVQYMLLQNTLSAVYEWAPLGAYQFVYGNVTIKKVELGIREIIGNEYRSTDFIPLPHTVLASMETFSIAQYAMSLCAVEPLMNSQYNPLGEDGYTNSDHRLPTSVRDVYYYAPKQVIEVEMDGTAVALHLKEQKGIDPSQLDDSNMRYELMEAAEHHKQNYWSFQTKAAAYIWYTYFRTERGALILKTLAQMVVSTPALLQLMGSCRRLPVDFEQLDSFVERFEVPYEEYIENLNKVEQTWKQALVELGKEVID